MKVSRTLVFSALFATLSLVACGEPTDDVSAGAPGDPCATSSDEGGGTSGSVGGGTEPAESPDGGAVCHDVGGDTPVSDGDDGMVVGDPDEPQARPSAVEPQPGQLNARAIGWEKAKVRADDRSVDVIYWSGVEPCYVLDRVEVAYGRDAVEITLFEGSSPDDQDTACIEIALQKRVVVELEELLDGRKLKDGST
jgi:hypothetical protein